MVGLPPHRRRELAWDALSEIYGWAGGIARFPLLAEHALRKTFIKARPWKDVVAVVDVKVSCYHFVIVRLFDEKESNTF